MDFIKNLIELLQKGVPPIHKEGQPFVFIFVVVSFLLGMLFAPLGWVGAFATLWCIYFFRDPARAIPADENLLVSPADGLVQKIEKAAPPVELGLGDSEVTRISIFLNVFDVHVNRIPIAGEVTELNYRPGKFLSANLDKASEENERQSVVVKTEDGKKVVFVQIAGLIARRIVCNLTEGQQVATGDRYGIIRFGSRVDVYLPEGIESLAVEGQRAVGGETILADLKGKQNARRGEIK